jgi:hypothetical protein
MISGLAPGKPALMDIVGKSTCGSGATGNKRNATAPDRNTAMTRSVVATGRLMNGSEIFIGQNNFKWQKAKGKCKTTEIAPSALCHSISPHGILVVRALPFVVATAFDKMARNCSDSSRIADRRLLGMISALASNRSQ